MIFILGRTLCKFSCLISSNYSKVVEKEGFISNLVRLENAIIFITVVTIYFMFGFSVWIFLIFLLVPDIFMLGYLIDRKIGSYIYNVGHSYIIPTLITLLYLAIGADILLIIGLIWLAHIRMVRTFGYGLKYTDSFDKTTIQRL